VPDLLVMQLPVGRAHSSYAETSCSLTVSQSCLLHAYRAGPSGARAPAGNSRIRTLNLSSNNIGDKGATLLAEMLKVLAAAQP